MIIGVPKEIKNHEYRVGIVPAGVHALVSAGHTVFIEKDAGLGSGITDEEYIAAGAEMLPEAKDVFERAEMIIKVKEPLAQEYPLMREGQILYTYLHLAPAPELTDALLDRKVIGVAYETIQLADGSLPLLTPMSEVAGRMATQVGAYYLGKSHGGRGVLLGGVPGVHRGRITIVGGGVVGLNAAKIAVGLGAQVTILDVNQSRLAYVDDIFGNSITTLMSNKHTVAEVVATSNLVVGAVLIPGAKTPHLVTREMISSMAPGSVVVDVAIDQGGCIETSHATTHDDPVFLVDDVIHYCVANMPGEFARTSTFALNNVTLPYALALANKGVKKAIADDVCLRKGVNVCKGQVTCAPVAEALEKPYVDIMDCI